MTSSIEIKLSDSAYTMNGGVVLTDSLTPWDDITGSSVGDKDEKLELLKERYPYMLYHAEAPKPKDDDTRNACEVYTGESSYYIVEQFFTFLMAIKKELPHIHIGVRFRDGYNDTFTGAENFPAAYLYIRNSPFTLARVGFGTFRETHGAPKYTLWAPYVYNSKALMDTRNRAVSGVLERAVKNVKRYVRTPLPHTFASTVFRYAVEAHRHAVRESQQICLTARNTIMDREADDKILWFEELLRVHTHQKKYEGVHALPYELDATLYDDITEYFNATAKAQEQLSLVKGSFYQVHITEHANHVAFHRNRVFYDVTEIHVPKIDRLKSKAGSLWASTASVGDTTRYLASDVPEDIMQKISVLQVNSTDGPRSLKPTEERSLPKSLSHQEFILGVGFTASKGRLYYVVA